MKLFGFEIKKSNIERKSFVGRQDMFYGNGQDIVKGMYTYYSMYRMNADVRRCIEELQQSVCKGGYMLGKYKDGEFIQMPDDTINKLNYKQNFNSLKNDIVQSLEVTGNVFILKRKNFNDQTIGYKVLDTRYMSIIVSSDDEVVRYMYRDYSNGYANVISYDVEEIYHYIQTRDPDKKHFGISKMETLVFDVFSDEEGAISNFYSYKNGSLPAAVVRLKEGLTDNQMEEIYEDIRIKLGGSHNKNKLITHNSIEGIDVLEKSHTDMDYINQRKFTTEKVCAVFGVPRIVLNYTEGVNYSNAEMQYTKFIENTIRPYEKTLEVIINSLISEYTDLIFVINDNHIDDLEEKQASTIELVKNGVISRNEARIHLGFERYEEEYMDDITVQANTVLLEVVAGEPLTQEENNNNLT